MESTSGFTVTCGPASNPLAPPCGLVPLGMNHKDNEEQNPKNLVSSFSSTTI